MGVESLKIISASPAAGLIAASRIHTGMPAAIQTGCVHYQQALFFLPSIEGQPDDDRQL